jgi:hypothetical protein
MANGGLLLLLFLISDLAWSGDPYPGLQVDVRRDGNQYIFSASFDTPLTKCGAFHFLTDYPAATSLPGVIESNAHRQSVDTVVVDRTADERILFFNVRLRSTIKYVESPFERVVFTQLSGDSRKFQGSWDIEANQHGSTLRFHGLWEPDTLIPLFVIDHFARTGLVDKFDAIARLAEKRKDDPPSSCVDQRS